VATASHLRAAELPLIGTYKLLILEHYLPMIAFRSSLLQACITDRLPATKRKRIGQDLPGRLKTVLSCAVSVLFEPNTVRRNLTFGAVKGVFE
jgi:hypothetical protein